MVAACHVEWADNLAAMGQFDEAERHYESALPILRGIDDQRSVGVTLAQLGKLAWQRGDLAEAGKRYQEALATFRALGEPLMERNAWGQLGAVALAAKVWDEAEHCYREAVRLSEQMQDWPGLAIGCNQLALVAKGAGRLDEAERWYLRAIELGEQLRYNAELGKWLSNLANLYLGQGRLAEAEQYARRAAAIMETLDLSAEPWKTYQILAQIAQAQGRAEESAQWRRQEQESYAAYAGSLHEIREWIPIIQAVIAACTGDEAVAQKANTSLQQMEEGWPTTVAAVRQILAGQRDIETLREGLSRKSYVVVYTILGRLGGGSLDLTPGPSPERRGEEERARGGEEAVQTSRVSETLEVSAAETQRREQWGPVIEILVAACGGHPGAVAEVGPFLDELAQQPDWRSLAATLRRLLAGERAPAALFAGLDATDRWIVGEILRGLEPTSPPLAGEGPGEGSDSEGMTLDDLLNLVVTACGPEAPAGLGAQLHGFTQSLSTDSDAPEEARVLGRVLNHILSGERTPDVSALPPAVADKIRALLARLAGGG